MSETMQSVPLVEQDPPILEYASIKERKLLWLAFPLQESEEASYPYQPGEPICLKYRAEIKKLPEASVVVLVRTGVAYLFVPGQPTLFPLSGRFADAALVQSVTGQPLEFFGPYVDVAFKIGRAHV